MTTYRTDSQGKFIPATQRPDGTWRKPRRVRDGYVPQEEVPLYESKGKQFAQKPALPPGLSLEVVQKAKEKRERERLRQQREELRKAQNTPASGATAVDGADKQKGATAGNGKARSKKTPELPDILLDYPTLSSTIKTTAPSKSSKQAKQVQQQKQPAAEQRPNVAKGTATASTTSTAVDEELAAALASGVQLSSNHVAAGGDSSESQQQQQQQQQTDLLKKLRKLRKKIREIEAIEERLRTNDGPRPDKDQLEKVKRKLEIQREIEGLEAQLAPVAPGAADAM
ncbi:partner of Y14 and mago [Anopheles aquasalis]|uniref:partner of Y14 and mago n=1 Tax=Anopheles aquasalis TaxID=42839 RepID=UPI00215A5E53|nr:partner of Y14 and mago [Anopheles aquasalis]